MLQVYTPSFDEQDIEWVSSAIKSGWLNEAAYTKLLEEGIAKRINRKYAVVTTSGTTAIFLALKAMGHQRGDVVTVPNYTAIGVLSAVRLAGGNVLIVDTDDNGNIDIKSHLELDYIVAVHNNGVYCDVSNIREMYPDSIVIEDASQALGSFHDGKPLGSFGDISVMSLATSKIITMGQGGVVATDNYDTYQTLKALKDQGRVERGGKYMSEGYNFKVTEMQSALGCSQLTKLDDRVEKMKHIYKVYAEYIPDMEHSDETLFWRAFDMIPQELRTNKLVSKLREKGIETQPFYEAFNYMYYPRSVIYSRSGLYLPSMPNLTDENIEYVCKSIYRGILV